MKALLYILLSLAFVSDFRMLKAAVGSASQVVTLAPEGLAGVMTIGILLMLGYQKRLILSPKYVFIGLIFVALFIVGAIANSVSPGAFFWGIRKYFVFLPLFFLPAVFDFDERDLKHLLAFVLLLSFLQLPVSLYQRIFIYPITPTGDVVRGMFGTGAAMSTFLVGVIVMLYGLYTRRQISRFLLFVSLPILTLPMLINETKGVMVLLPVALVALTVAEGGTRFSFGRVMSAIGASIIFIAVFVVAYEVYFPREGEKFVMLDFLSGGVVNNVYKGTDHPDPDAVGRVDSIIYAIQGHAGSVVSLLTGFGAGNVSETNISVIAGEKGSVLSDYGGSKTTYALLIWELGLIGVLITLLGVFFVFLDAREVSKRQDFIGALGVGWVGVAAMLPVAFMYKNFIGAGVVSTIGFLLAGLMSAQRLLGHNFKKASE